jgi:peptide chain release factor 2
LKTSGGIFDIDGKKRELTEIERQIENPEFWKDQESQKTVLRRRRLLGNAIQLAETCRASLNDVEALIELHEEGEDVDADLQKEFGRLESTVSQVEIQNLLSGEHDASNAIVSIHPGAGGTESQDWAEMLLRLYLRWAEIQGFETEITDYQAGEEAGVKSVTFLVKGEFAFGYLSAEVGVHRLVRISPFDAGNRRHTSFASVSVTPEIEESEVEIEIDEGDLRIDTYRSSGAGGQHVNVTDSAVRITHLPSGIVVQCQNERSQHRNKETAMRILRSKLYELERQRKMQELEELGGEKADIAWGSQIRSYVLHPYQMVKDHRTKEEIGNVQAVLDGHIDAFIISVLRQRGLERQRKQPTT